MGKGSNKQHTVAAAQSEQRRDNARGGTGAKSRAERSQSSVSDRARRRSEGNSGG